MEVGGQRNAPVALPPGKRPGAGGRVDPRAGLDGCGKSRPRSRGWQSTVVAVRADCWNTRPVVVRNNVFCVVLTKTNAAVTSRSLPYESSGFFSEVGADF